MNRPDLFCLHLAKSTLLYFGLYLRVDTQACIAHDTIATAVLAR